MAVIFRAPALANKLFPHWPETLPSRISLEIEDPERPHSHQGVCMNNENELFLKQPGGRRPTDLSPAKEKTNLSGFITIRLPANVFIEGDDLRKYGKEKLPHLARLLERHPKIATRRLIRSVDPEKLLKMEKNAAYTQFPPLHSLTSYWQLDCRKLTTPIETILKLLHGLSEIDFAYLEKAASDSSVDASNDTHADRQHHLDPAPLGIDARWAWTQTNGAGAGVGFVDLEQAWNLNHEDLIDKGPTLSYGDNRYGVNGFPDHHGTAVLGTVVGVDNGVGIVGVAPEVSSVRVVSRFELSTDPAVESTDQNIASAILHAIDIMAPGDVLLLEVDRNLRPTETDDGDFNAIRLASASGIIVVEAAGNRNTSLDTWINEEGTRRLDRDPDNDSGAIIVGSCESALEHNRYVGSGIGEGSNHGVRLDCFAWGEDITTTGFGDLDPGSGDNSAYRNSFDGTSGASAIIAGAALILQGIYQATAPIDPAVPGRARLSPPQMRALLSNPATGTRQGGSVLGRIGRMPNLRAIFSVPRPMLM